MWNDIVVCDVWGVIVPRKSIGLAVSNWLRGPGVEGFRLLHTGFPLNGAVLAVIT